ncbi:MAG: MBL fold metallo-hydrolase [Gammaproteobacteria bacterium]|jgi:glyoxylase-like metal-dependent hydrolase (beta-lactamase superfamily II)
MKYFVSHRLLAAAALAAVSLLLSGAANAQGGFGPPEPVIVDVTDNVHIIRFGFAGNVTALINDGKVALIDTKFEMDFDTIMEQLRTITDAPVVYVINTHLHGDHTGGNARMQELKARVIASANARRIMSETQDAGLADITFEEHMRLHLGDMPIDLYYFGRGHTDGDVYIHLPRERILFTGDQFALWGEYDAVIDYASGGSARDWPRSLERALALDFDTVIPGHSGVTDRAMMEGYRDYLIRIRETVQEMNRQQRTREEIQEVMETEFGWSGLSVRVGVDGMMAELR